MANERKHIDTVNHFLREPDSASASTVTTHVILSMNDEDGKLLRLKARIDWYDKEDSDTQSL